MTILYSPSGLNGEHYDALPATFSPSECLAYAADHKLADLQVMQPTKLDLIINQTTSKALGLTVSDQVLALADEVIE